MFFWIGLAKMLISIGVAFFIARWFGGMGVGAPLVPLKKRDWQDGFALAQVQPDELVIDLGSGDGRLLEAAAERGAKMIGYEINPIMVWYARRRLKKYADRTQVFAKNLLEADVSKADVIFIFQMGTLMPKIKEKLLKEVKKGTRVVTFAFVLPDVKIEKEQGIAKLYRF